MAKQLTAKEKFNALADAKHIFAFKEEGTPFKLLDIVNAETGCKAIVELEDGTIAYLLAGRNAQHGYHVETEIIGTEGMIRIGNAPEKNLVTVYDKNGVVRPTSGHFPERFKLAFINEINAFINMF